MPFRNKDKNNDTYIFKRGDGMFLPQESWYILICFVVEKIWILFVHIQVSVIKKMFINVLKNGWSILNLEVANIKELWNCLCIIKLDHSMKIITQKYRRLFSLRSEIFLTRKLWIKNWNQCIWKQLTSEGQLCLFWIFP